MKIKFVQGHKPKGDAASIPEYKSGETYDFNGPVAEGYARKYIARGHAVESKDEPKPEPVADVAVDVPVAEAAVDAPKLKRFNNPTRDFRR